jgi:hypothetical protein
VPCGHRALIAVNTRLVTAVMPGLQSGVPRLNQLAMAVVRVVSRNLDWMHANYSD